MDGLVEARLGLPPVEASPLDPRLVTLLRRKQAKRDVPTATHYTFELSAYWEDDFVDAVRAGLRRKIRVGGLRSAGRGNLAVELAEPLRPYTAVRLAGPRATVVFPAAAAVAMRGADGQLERPSLQPARAPFEARAAEVGFEQTLAFRVGTLSFVARFVHRDGPPRQPFDWIRALVAGRDL